MIPLALLLLLAAPAAAQRPGCGYGEGLAALRQAEARLAAVPGSLSAGREVAAAASDGLAAAAASLAGCGCPRAADQAREAAGIAEQARGEVGLERLQRLLDRTGFGARLARERLGRGGCG